MESACVYDETTVIHELTQGIKMAEQLRVNLNSPEARQFLIQNILSSYDKALFILKSGGQPRASALQESSPPKSYISTSGPQSIEIEFNDPSVVSKKRKASTTWEDEVRILPVNESEGKTVDKLQASTAGENLANLRATLSFKAWDFDATDLSSSLSPHSTQFEFRDDDFHSLNFPNHFDEELLQGYSPPFISPATSESNYFTDLWSSSLESPTDSTYVYPDFMS